MTKKLIRKNIDSLDLYGSAESVIAQLQSYVDEYGPGMVTLSEESRPYSDSTYIAIFASIPETDKQEQERERQEKNLKLTLEAQERADFERLSAKYGK